MAADIAINYVTRYVGKTAARSVIGDNRAVRKSVDDVSASNEKQARSNERVTTSTNRVVQSVNDATSSNRTYSKSHSIVRQETDKTTSTMDRFTKSLRDSNTKFLAFKNIISLFKWPALITGAGYAAQALSSLGAAAGGLVSALAPLSGLLVAYPTALGAIGQAAGTATLAFNGISAGLKELNKKFAETHGQSGETQTAMEKLTPAARKLTQFLFGLRNKLQDLKKTASSNLLPGVERGLKSALPLFPRIQGAIKLTARVMGGLAEQAGSLVGSKGFGRDFTKVTQGNARFLGMMGQSALMLGRALTNVLVVAQPFTKWMGQAAESASHWLLLQSQVGRKGGGLAQFFEESKGAANKLWVIIKNVGMALGNILKAAKPLGNEILVSLGKGAESFNAWTSSVKGRNELRDYFERAKAPIFAMGRLARDVTKAFFSLGNQPGVASLTEELRTKLLPILTELIGETTKAFGPHLVNMLVSIGKLFAGIGGNSGPLVTFTDAVTRLVNTFNDILTTVPGAKGALVSFLGIMAVGKATKFVLALTGLGKVVGILKTMVGWQRKYNAALAGEEVGGVIGALAKRKGAGSATKATTVAEQVAGAGILSGVPGKVGTKFLMRGAGGLALGGAALGIGSLVGGKGGEAISNIGGGAAAGMMFGPWGAAAGAAIGAIITFRKQIKDVLGEVFDFVKKHAVLVAGALSVFFGPLPLIAVAVVKWRTQIIGAFSDAFDWIKNATGNVVSWVSGAWGTLVKFFSSLPGKLVSGIKALPGLWLAALKKTPYIIGWVVGFWLTLPVRIGGAVVALTKKIGPVLADLASRVVSLGARAVTGYVKFWLSMPGWIADLISNLVKRVVGLLGALAGRLLSLGGRALKALYNGVTNGAVAVFNFFKALPGRVVGFLTGGGASGLVGKLLNAGKKGIEGLVKGFKAGAKGLWEFVREVPGKIASIFSSLASKFLEIGKNIAKEVAKGFYDALPGPVKDAVGAAGDVADFINPFGAKGGVVQSTGMIGGAGRNGKRFFADGGVVGGWGKKGYDSVLAMVAPGEVILTDHHQAPINYAVENTYGTTLPNLVESIQTPHHYSLGGVVQPGVTVPRFAWGGVGPAGLHTGIKNMASYVMDKFPGLQVTSTTGGTHAAGSYHYKGEAVDLAGSNMDGAAGYIGSTLARWLAEGIHNPNLSVKYGKPVSPSYWGATTWADHLDHIHLAVAQPWTSSLIGGATTGTSGTAGLSGAGTAAPKPFYAHYSLPSWKLNKAGMPVFGVTSSYKGALSAVKPHNPPKSKAKPGQPSNFKAGGMTIKGPVSWFNGGATAGGSDTSKPGIAVNLDTSSEPGGWDNSKTRKWREMSLAGHPQFARVSIAGKTANLPITDMGPASWTKRAIDVTEGGVRKLGLSTSAFPTDSIGTAQLLARGGFAGRRRFGRGGRARIPRFATGTAGVGGKQSTVPTGGTNYNPRWPISGATTVPALPHGLVAQLLNKGLKEALEQVSKAIDGFGIYKTMNMARQVKEAFRSAETSQEKAALTALAVTTSASWIDDIAKAHGYIQRVMIHRAAESVTEQIKRIKKGGVTQPEQHILQQLYNQRSSLISLSLNNAGERIEKGGPATISRTIKSLQSRIKGFRQGGTTRSEQKLIRGIQTMIQQAQFRITELAIESGGIGKQNQTIKHILAVIKRLRKGGVSPKERGVIRKLQGFITDANERIYAILGEQGNVAALQARQRQLQQKLAQIAQGGVTRRERALYNSVKEQLDSIGEAMKTAVEVQAEQLAAAVEAAAKTAEMGALRIGATEIGLERIELEQKLAGTYETPAAAKTRAEYLTNTVVPRIQEHIGQLQAEEQALLAQGDTAGAMNVQNEIAQEQNKILAEQLEAQEIIKQESEKTNELLEGAAGSLGFSFGSQNFTDLLGVGVGT